MSANRRTSAGWGIPFYLDAEANRVLAPFTPGTHHSGAPLFAHGGFSQALLDEGMAWAVIAIAHRFGITRKSEVTFARPVKIDQPHTVAAWIASRDGHDLVALAEITDARGKVCVSVRSSFYVMTKEEADAAIGAQSSQTATYTEG